MAMQYIEGADLGSVLAGYRQDREYIKPEDALRITRQIGAALDFAHGCGVIHRDVKPSNVILDKEGAAHLTDFGLVLLKDLGTLGEIFGSPHYIAPEQAISSAGTVPQSDLYALGVILYEMFTGQLPFDADSPMGIAMLHMTEPPRPPGELRPEMRRAEAVILMALARSSGAIRRHGPGRWLGKSVADARLTRQVSDTQNSVRSHWRRAAAHPLPPIPQPSPPTELPDRGGDGRSVPVTATCLSASGRAARDL
jgi:serine/threonine protein kinase